METEPINDIDLTPVVNKLDVIISNNELIQSIIEKQLGWLVCIFIIMSIVSGLLVGYIVGKRL